MLVRKTTHIKVVLKHTESCQIAKILNPQSTKELRFIKLITLSLNCMPLYKQAISQILKEDYDPKEVKNYLSFTFGLYVSLLVRMKDTERVHGKSQCIK
jgi:hypothetical protein